LSEGETSCPSCQVARLLSPEGGPRAEEAGGPGRLEDEDTLILRLLEEGRPAAGEGGRGHLWLIDPRGGQIERSCELSAPLTVIGRRSGCDIFLANSAVSRRHAEIRREGDSYFLHDLNSTNGTLLNGEPVIGEEQLRDWDEIGIGIFKLIFRQE
jgi:hypothetical protein